MPVIDQDFIGKRFGRLLVLGPTREGEPDHRYMGWRCQCDCGKTVSVYKYSISSGATKSCGCLVRDTTRARSRRHGHCVDSKRSRAHSSWHAMLTRCSNPSHPGYPDYGGRGITVCDHWKSFDRFLEDMGEPPPGCSLERVNNSLGYSPENCIWADRLTQSNNRRNVAQVTINGDSRSIADWARCNGIKPKTAAARMRKGWPPELAVTVPVVPGQKLFPRSRFNSAAPENCLALPSTLKG